MVRAKVAHCGKVVSKGNKNLLIEIVGVGDTLPIFGGA